VIRKADEGVMGKMGQDGGAWDRDSWIAGYAQSEVDRGAWWDRARQAAWDRWTGQAGSKGVGGQGRGQGAEGDRDRGGEGRE
jgi:hypothetical protein